MDIHLFTHAAELYEKFKYRARILIGLFLWLYEGFLTFCAPIALSGEIVLTDLIFSLCMFNLLLLEPLIQSDCIQFRLVS